MKLHPKQLAAIREKLNRVLFLLECGDNAGASALCDDLSGAIGLADRRSEMKGVTTSPEASSGAWQEAK